LLQKEIETLILETDLWLTYSSLLHTV